MIWNTLKIVTGSESPIVVVLRYASSAFLGYPDFMYYHIYSGSMEPAFYRGDLLFLWMSDAPIEIGEIVVYKLDGRDIPIVHRILETHERYLARPNCVSPLD